MSRASGMTNKGKGSGEKQAAFVPASRTGRKTLSVDLPADQHLILKRACVDRGIPIRDFMLAVIEEVDNGTDAAAKIFDTATEEN